MNVINSIAAFEGQPNTAAGGKTATELGGLSLPLFSLELGNALLEFQLPETTTIPSEISEEDLRALEELLAMFQQAAAFATNPATSILQQPERSDTSLSVPPDMQAAMEKLSVFVHTLTSGQSKISSVAEQIAPLKNHFEKLVNTWEESSPQLKQAAVQVNDVLSKYIKQSETESGSTPKGTSVQTGLVMNQHRQFTGGNQHVAKPTVEVSRQEQTLRIKQAITMYGAEAAAITRVANGKADVNTQAAPIFIEGSKQQPESLFNQSNHAPVIPAGMQPGLDLKQESQVSSYQVDAKRFTQEVPNIFVRQMKLATIEGVSQAKLILHPQSLGQVDVTITSQNGVITAHFAADTQNGKEVLDNQLSQLRTALVQQGLQVEKIEVTHQPGQNGQNLFDLGQQREQERQQSRQQQENRQPEEDQAEFTLEQLINGIPAITA